MKLNSTELKFKTLCLSFPLSLRIKELFRKIVSLPRGVFKKGTTTRSIKSGSQTASMKMSILYVEKIKPVIKGKGYLKDLLKRVHV